MDVAKEGYDMTYETWVVDDGDDSDDGYLDDNEDEDSGTEFEEDEGKGTKEDVMVDAKEIEAAWKLD